MSDTSAMPEIITFYSYKGGTGRSMALANVAWILASNGKRVLLLDWDLEAPGLHRYLHPFLRDKTLTSSEGIIDFVIDFAYEAVAGGEKPSDWYLPHANILRYACSIDWQFPSPGTIDFVPAGRQGSDYAARVNSFNWENFYRRLGGGVFLEAAKKSMAGYDYVLIDSRTGVSDTSGVCTVQMPDKLVVCFTLNTQSIEGAAAVAASALKQRQKPDGAPGLKIFPVPTRVDLAEKDKLDLANELARERFDPLLWHILPNERDLYWSRVRVLYQSFYAYEEVLATFGDKPQQPQSVVLPSMEAVASYITDDEVRQFPPLEESKRLDLLDRYLRKPKPVKPHAGSAAFDSWIFYFSYDRSNDGPDLDRFFDDLSEEVRELLGRPRGAPVGFRDKKEIVRQADWADEVGRGLRTSQTIVCIVSPAYVKNTLCGKEFAIFEERERLALDGANKPDAILPVRWISVVEALPEALGRRRFSDSADAPVYRERGLRYLMRLTKYEDLYRELVSRLATWLVESCQRASLPLLDQLAPFDEIPNAFVPQPSSLPQSEEPQHVDFVCVVASREEMRDVRNDVSSYSPGAEPQWYPFRPSVEYSLGVLAQQTASALDLTCSLIALDADYAARLEEAERKNIITVLMVDPWTLMLSRYRDMMMDLDQRLFLNRVTLILWSHDDETLQRRAALITLIQDTFRRGMLSRDAYFRTDIDSADDFRKQLSDAVRAIRVGMVQRMQALDAVFNPNSSWPYVV